ncbi:MAG TPA: prolyl oligopeptidase family serine peptidase [Gammaproteobacteria bacterium]
MHAKRAFVLPASTLMVTIAGTGVAQPPPSPTESFSYSLHGESIEDPYLWLEGSDAPEVDDEALDARVSEWTDAQNAYTRGILDALPGRAAFDEELSALLSLDAYGIPTRAGDWLFYTLRRGEQPQPVLYATHTPTDDTRVLIDVNRLDDSGLLALDWYRPSPDGRYVAYGTYEAGDELTTAFVLETETGEVLEDRIGGRVDPVDWLDDSEQFVVRTLSDTDNPYSGLITLHRLGSDATDDPVLFSQYTEGELATTWGPYPIVSRDGRWLVVIYFTGTDSNDVWFYDLDDWRDSGELVRRDLLIGEDALTSGFVEDDTFYAITTLGASNKRVIAFDLAGDDPAAYRELVREDPNAVLDAIYPAEGQIVADYLASAYSRIRLFDRDGDLLTDVQLPGIGSAQISTEATSSEAWLRFESFSEPEGIYRVDLTRGATSLWRRPELPVDTSDLTVTQIFYASADGTRIPMFLVHRRDVELDGDNPTLLYGYGGFDISLTPSFTPAWLPWLARGGVYAVANLRGGGEFGADWHRAGMLENKQNVFDDFYAAAEWLIDSGYTRVGRLGIAGRSNGGLLTGVAITQRPELFSAAIVGVPLLDMLRYQNFLMARYWVPEYGSSENAGQFDFLRAYSPYQNVRAGVSYPATLLTAGENDMRVHALHARKMAAALQAATASDVEQEPVMLWVDRSAGHGQGKPLAARVSETVDQVLFMAWQLGLGDREVEGGDETVVPANR